MTALQVEVPAKPAPVPSSRMQELAGMLAHELRNPLASACTNLAVATDLCVDGDPRAPFLRRAEHELDRIRDLLDACLDLACAGRVRIVETAVAHLVRETLAPFAAGATIESDVDADLHGRFDPVLVKRALENLCENALRALAGRPGTLRVTAMVRDGALELTVEDSGPGIAREVRDRIFEPFVTGSRGSGLGLAFVRQVAAAHGGDVDAGDSMLGGARFVVRLPQQP